MDNCEFCDLLPDDEKWMFYESDFWKIYLSDKQDYIGRCIIVSKRHCESLACLNLNEWDDLKCIINSLEKMVSKILHATMFNWSCLMNNGYKKDNSCPHVHFHVRPRYKQTLTINGKEYTDEEFAHHYVNDKENKLDDESRDVLFSIFKNNIEKYF